jgi:hypothetical protein
MQESQSKLGKIMEIALGDLTLWDFGKKEYTQADDWTALSSGGLIITPGSRQEVA